MDIITLHDAPGYDRDRTVAQPFLDGSQCNMRHPAQSWPGAAPSPDANGAIAGIERPFTVDHEEHEI
jgi:hypothetical protein